MKARFKLAVALVAAAFLGVFMLVPLVPVGTHGTDQLAFLKLKSTDSIGCFLLGFGASTSPELAYQHKVNVSSSSFDESYRLGCPPK